MRSRLLRLSYAFALAGLLWAAAFSARSQGADPKAQAAGDSIRAITIPQPESSEPSTNSQQSGIKKDGLKQVEDDLFKPLKKQFSLKSSLDAVLVQPQPRLRRDPVPQTKKEKEEEAEKREWVFLSPDEVASGPTIEEIFNVPEYG